MTVSTTANRIQYTGNGVTVSFSFPYLFYADTDLTVYLDDAVQSAGYTVSGEGSPSGGSVLFSAAPSVDVIVTIERTVALSQGTDFEDFDGNPADVTEKQFDLVVMMAQQNADAVVRSLKFAPTVVGSITGSLPQPDDGMILVWDGNTGAIGNSSVADISTSIDTVFTSLASGDFISYNGTNWVNTPLGTQANTWSATQTFTGKVITPNDGTLTIATGAVTVTGANHKLDTEAAASTDNLDTINGGADGQILVLQTVNSARDVVVTTAGNIVTPDGNNIPLSSTSDALTLQYNSTLSKWVVLSRSVPSLVMQGLSGKILNGLTLSNNVADATNDIDIAAGSCVSDDGTTVLVLSAITKRLDAAWAVGTNQGGLDTGAIANTTYFVFVIGRVDTGVTDVLLSASPTAPTMPSGYTKKKRIGAIIRASAAILPFTQYMNEFRLSTQVIEVDATNPGTSAVTRTLTAVPLGLKTLAMLSVGWYPGTTGATVLVTSLDQNDQAAQAFGTAALTGFGSVGSNNGWNFAPVRVATNTSAQVRSRASASGAADHLGIITLGWIDYQI